MHKLLVTTTAIIAVVMFAAAPSYAGDPRTGLAAGFEDLGHTDTWYRDYNRPRPRGGHQYYNMSDSACVSCHTSKSANGTIVQRQVIGHLYVPQSSK